VSEIKIKENSGLVLPNPRKGRYLMSEIALAGINSFAPVAQQAEVPPAEEPIFASATAAQALQVLEGIIDRQDEKIAALECELESRPSPSKYKDLIQEAVNEVMPTVMDEVDNLRIRVACLEASLGDGGL